jgi:hypothetical protein
VYILFALYFFFYLFPCHLALPPVPHLHQYLLLVVFLMIVILTGVRWNLSMVLICISLIAKDGEYFFLCFLAIWTSSFEKGLFSLV